MQCFSLLRNSNWSPGEMTNMKQNTGSMMGNEKARE